MQVGEVVYKAGLEIVLNLVDDDLMPTDVSAWSIILLQRWTVPNVGDLDISKMLLRLVDGLIDFLVVFDPSPEVFGSFFGILTMTAVS